MANFNKVLLMGNLTRDPELRYTQSGTAIVKFGLAVNRRYRSQSSQEMVEETTFVDVEGWGRQAETFNQYMSKGRPTFIEGRLRLDSWEGKDGQKRNKLVVVMENFQFLGGGTSRNAGRQPSESSQPGQIAEPSGSRRDGPPPAQGEDYDFDDIPF